MKITKQDIKTLNKIKKMSDKLGCEECIFNKNKCILQNLSLIHIQMCIRDRFHGHKNQPQRLEDGTYIKGESFDYEIFLPNRHDCLCRKPHARRTGLRTAQPDFFYDS